MSKKVAILCFADGLGGMELDAWHAYQLFSSSAPSFFITRTGTDLEQKVRAHPDWQKNIFSLKFSSRMGLALIWGLSKLQREHQITHFILFGVSEVKALFWLWYFNPSLQIFLRHGTFKTQSKKDFFHQLFYRCVTGHFAVGESILQNVKSIFPYNDQTLFKVVYPSVKFSLKIKPQTEQSNPQKFKIIHTARVAEGKGQDHALQALAILAEKKIDFEFLIVGDNTSEYAKDLMQKSARHFYADKIKFLGHQSHVADLLCQADIFLFPSFGEGFTNSFLEALAMGLVCISYDNTCFPEFRELGFKFLMAENKNILSLKEKILEAVLDFNKLQSLAIENQKLVLQKFQPHNEWSGYHDLLF